MTLDNIKSMEESLIDELRDRFKGNMSQDLYKDDDMFVRFLRARNHNLDAAESMLKNHLNWRKQYKLITILTEFTPHKFMSSKYMPLSRLGHDLDGAPLSYVHFGGLDTRGVLRSASKEDITKFIIHYLEIDMAAMKKKSIMTGKNFDKCVYIVNFENFSLASATHKQTLETLCALVLMYERNYPERLKTAYAINVSYYFTIFWMVIKQFLSSATLEKVKIYGKTGWQEELLQHISPDVLPAFLGGNRADPNGNPMCKTFIKFGGTVPESLYEYTKQDSRPKRGNKKLQVPRMLKAEVTSHVPFAGSTLEWDFVVKHRDVNFSVNYKENDNSNSMQVVVPQQRIEAQSGMYLCEKAGIYVIEFDNTYSWVHSKEIYYTVTVVPPAND